MELIAGGAGPLSSFGPQTGKTAVIVIRAWLEGEPHQLRARLTGSLDLADQASELTATAGSIEDVLAQLRAWLEAFAA